jgi:acyl-CoA synthetase (AMP-forming)/AMP-acid ligase II
VAVHTLAHSLARAARSARGAIGVTLTDRRERDETLAWREVWGGAVARAEALARRGVRPGDRVALVLPTGRAFLEAFYACQLARAIAVPVYPPVRLGRLEEYYERTAGLLRAVDARLVVTDRLVHRLLGETLRRFPPALGAAHVEDVAPACGDATWRLDGRVDEIALIQFSSGTTGSPKPIALTHRQILANVHAMAAYVARGPEDRALSWLPLYHDMGLMLGLVGVVEEEASVTLLRPEDFLASPALWLRTLARHRCTVSAAPNFAYELAASRIADAALDGVDLSGWRLAFCGAEPIAPATLTRFAARMAPHGFRAAALKPVYGLAEAVLGVAFTPADRGFRVEEFAADRLLGARVAERGAGRALVSVGRALPGFEIAVRDAAGREAAPAAIGRIHVRGPSVTSGYVAAATGATLELREAALGGWLDTGDEGFLWDGELLVTGRAKDLVILRGRKLAPQDLERTLDDVEDVRRGCTVAAGHVTERGEELVLFVETYAPSDALAEACRRAVTTAHAVTASAVVLLAPGTIPRTSSGKLRRGDTLRAWQQGALAAPRPVNALTLGLAMARNAWAQLRP